MNRPDDPEHPLNFTRLPGWKPSDEEIQKVIDDLNKERVSLKTIISSYLQFNCVDWI